MRKPVDIVKHRESYLAFIDDRKNMILSLKDEEQKPFISYAPFVKKDGKFYIYISEIAEHFRYMENNEYVDVLLIADEAATKNKFATERARFLCTSENIGNQGHDEIFTLFEEAHGSAIMDLLRSLDFSLFELTPISGRYVVGFGLAFNLNIDATTFEHVVVDKKKEA